MPAIAAFESEILAYEAQDTVNPPRKGVIVFIGSSSIRGWYSLTNDMWPLEAINRGFGGSQAKDAVEHADRIVTPYEPTEVVFYEGDNDIASGVTPEEFVVQCASFTDKVHAELPNARIYFLAVKPSIARWNIWPTMQEANTQLEAYTQTSPLLEYIDIATPMFDGEGELLQDIWNSDGLHMNYKGYIIWTNTIKPRLAGGTTPYYIDCTAYPDSLFANGLSISVVTAVVRDANHFAVNRATCAVTFSTAGEGTVATAPSVTVSTALARADIQATILHGGVTVYADAPGLGQGSVFVMSYEVRGPEEEIRVEHPNLIANNEHFSFNVYGAEGTSTIKVYTISGRLVKTIFVPGGNGEIDWDLLNEEGNTIRPGMYLFTITDSAGKKQTGKIVIKQ